MRSYKLLISLISTIALMLTQSLYAYSDFDKIDGLEYDIRKLEDVPLEQFITRRYDLYEIYFENRSNKTFSIPGYSIDLGVDYSTLDDVYLQSKDKSQNKLAVLKIATGAASIAFGGIARRAATTAINSVNNLRRKHINTAGNKSFLSNNKTYVLYPADDLSIFIFVDRLSSQIPDTFRFICHDEELNQNQVVINNKIKPREVGNVIAAPNTEQYK